MRPGSPMSGVSGAEHVAHPVLGHRQVEHRVPALAAQGDDGHDEREPDDGSGEGDGPARVALRAAATSTRAGDGAPRRARSSRSQGRHRTGGVASGARPRRWLTSTTGAARPDGVPDAVHRAGADPLARRQRAVPGVLLQRRAARQLPRHRPRVPVDEPRPAVAVPVRAGGPGHADRARPPARGEGRHRRRLAHLLRPRHVGTAALGDPARGLRRRRRGDDVRR